MKLAPVEISGPHAAEPLVLAGAPLETARAALVLLHGRGASAQDILLLGEELQLPGLALIAPQASGSVWYPNRFLAPTQSNEPWLSSALSAVDAAVQYAAQSGIPLERVFLAGFSQGASLILEYTARNGTRYGGVAGLSGALIGAAGEPRKDAGDLNGTPVLLGCSDVDPYIPVENVRASAKLLRQRGAVVHEMIFTGMAHTVNAEEIEFLRGMIAEVLG